MWAASLCSMTIYINWIKGDTDKHRRRLPYAHVFVWVMGIVVGISLFLMGAVLEMAELKDIAKIFWGLASYICTNFAFHIIMIYATNNYREMCSRDDTFITVAHHHH